jgi:ketosteroid isomerase-like protein
MDKRTKLLMNVLLALGLVGFTPGHKSKAQEVKTMSRREENIEVMRKLFRAVEDHDQQTLIRLSQPDVEFHWPPSLPYGGRNRGTTWGETWALLQPSEAERKMDARIVAASDDEVVALWHQRGLSPGGDRFDGEVLGLYQFREGKLARAQMFYFDSTAVNNFLAKAITPEQREKSRALFGQLQRFSEQRQLLLRQAYWRLQTMPPDQQRQELRSGISAKTFSDDERAVLEQLLGLNVTHEK